MNKKTSKRQRDIKSKLMAAICMLLVSSIMMVSTTYAWFTLSTAPEVTGITTAVGANGNLEMALLPKTGLLDEATTSNDFNIKTSTGDSMAIQSKELANITWGNLVDLNAVVSGTNAYGMDNITLYPAALNYSGEGKAKVDISAFLSTPSYGADGRVAKLEPGTVTGVYDGTSFVQKLADNDKPAGVRVIGNVSGMSERQIAYRNAISLASSAASDAGQKAGASLNNNGSGLGNIVIKYATAATSYDDTDKGVLQNLVTALSADDGPLKNIEKSIRYFAYAYEISANEGYAEKQDAILSTTALDALVNSLTDSTNVPTILSTMISELNESWTAVNNAQTKLNSLSGGNYTWTDISDAMKHMVNTDNATINGLALSGENKASKDDIISSYINQQSLTLTLPTGSGVYADIADHVGDYSASITIPGDSLGYAGVNVPCTMNAHTTLTAGTYQSQAKTYYANNITVPGMADATNAPISDYYGYIIDLAFKTNASNSYLKLQSDAIDRIYNGEGQTSTTEETMGHGSTMTFTSSSNTFTNAQMIELMKNIRVVFFDPATGSIYAYALLDTEPDNIVYEGSSVTVKMKAANYEGEGEDATLVAVDDNKIMDLNQNEAKRLSVLVYLDGENVTNEDVAFDKATSMTGSINLQFASSAALVPMNYSDLASIEGENTNGNETTYTATDVTTGTVTTDYAATVKHIASGTTYKLVAVVTKDSAPVTEGVTVQIGDKTATYATVGTYSGWVVDGEETAPQSVDVTVTPTT